MEAASSSAGASLESPRSFGTCIVSITTREGRSTWSIWTLTISGTDSQGHDAMVAAFWRRVYDELARYGAVPELSQKILGNKQAVSSMQLATAFSARLFENTEMHIVLLLDETDDLLDRDSTHDFALVRRLRALMASSGRRFKAVFAGLQSVQRYYSWKNHPFAQLGRELVVNPLPPAAAQELHHQAIEGARFRVRQYEAGAKNSLPDELSPGPHPDLRLPAAGQPLCQVGSAKRGKGQFVKSLPMTLLAVERDRSVMDDIRNRFDWTP